MNQESIGEKLLATFGEETIEGTVLFRDQATVTVAAESIITVCRFLKDDPELAFDFLSFLGGVDRYPATPRFEVVYQLYSLKHNHRFRVKARIGESEENGTSIDSVVEIWIPRGPLGVRLDSARADPER